ncbi:hypothetical protein LguiA_006999 [Lonicera macranthoides]
MLNIESLCVSIVESVVYFGSVLCCSWLCCARLNLPWLCVELGGAMVELGGAVTAVISGFSTLPWLIKPLYGFIRCYLMDWRRRFTMESRSRRFW